MAHQNKVREFERITAFYRTRQAAIDDALSKAIVFLKDGVEGVYHRYVQGQLVEGDWAPRPLLDRTVKIVPHEVRSHLLEERGQRFRAALIEHGLQHLLLDLNNGGALYCDANRDLITQYSTSPSTSWILREGYQAYVAETHLDYDPEHPLTYMSLLDLHELVGARVSARPSVQAKLVREMSLLGLLSTTLTADQNYRIRLGRVGLSFMRELYYPELQGGGARMKWILGTSPAMGLAEG